MEIIKRAGAKFQEASEGAVLGRACDSFLEAMENCFALDEPVLDRVQSMVENLELYVPKMEKHTGDNHQAELLEELKEGMTRGRTLLNRLEASDWGWFKERYNNQLVQLDSSLKSLVKKLRLQSAVDVKEILVSTEKTGQVAKKTKRKVDEMDEKINHVQKGQEMILNMMKKQEQKALANQAEQLFKGAAVVAGLQEIADRTSNYRYEVFLSFREPMERIRQTTLQTIGLVDLKTEESKKMLYFQDGELSNFRVLIEEGLEVLLKIPTIQEWTDELESEYKNKLLDLERTIEALYKRLDGMQPFRLRRCGNCDKSRAASTSTMGYPGTCR